MPYLLTDTKLAAESKHNNLRRILFEDFKSIGGELQIKGGWGYSEEDAIIIDKDDPVVDSELPFNGVGLEYLIVEKRIYEELIIFRPEGEQYSGIEWKLDTQRCYSNNEKMFDHLVFNVTCFADKDWNTLKKEMTENINSPDFDMAAHLKKRESLKRYYQSEYFFDITSFWGNRYFTFERIQL